MSSLYLRIAMYALIAIGLVWLGMHYESSVWSAKYNALIAADASASLAAQRVADENIARLSSIYDEKLTSTESSYESQLATGRSASARLAASLRNYQNRRCVNPLPASPAAPGKSNDAAANAGSDGGIAEATRRVFDAAAADAAQLSALESERAAIMLQNVTITAKKAK